MRHRRYECDGEIHPIIHIQYQNKHTTLFTNYDYKSHILSATNNNVLAMAALHLQ